MKILRIYMNRTGKESSAMLENFEIMFIGECCKYELDISFCAKMVESTDI